MKILIAVPTFETILPETFKSIYDLEKGEHEVIFDFIRGYDCATARNKIAKKGLELQTDYILTIDNDVTIPSDSLMRFLEDPKEVCLGCYPQRNAQNEYSGYICLYHTGEYDYTKKFHITEIEEKKFRVHGGGMGCAFIKTDIFNKLKYPWFYWKNYKDGSSLSEDLYFCQQCNDAGIEIYADGRIKCGHQFRKIQYCDILPK